MCLSFFVEDEAQGLIFLIRCPGPGPLCFQLEACCFHAVVAFFFVDGLPIDGIGCQSSSLPATKMSSIATQFVRQGKKVRASALSFTSYNSAGRSRLLPSVETTPIISRNSTTPVQRNRFSS